MSDKQTVLVELLIAAPADEVWRAMREPEEIARWFGWKYPGLAGEIDMYFVGGSTADDAARRLEFPTTGDIFTVEARGAQSIVRLIRAAPADGSWDDIYDDVIEGWTTFLQQLRFTLERHPKDERYTIYLNGRMKAAADGDPIAAAGLAQLAGAAKGERYTLASPIGDTLHGTVWFRSKHQVGVTVDELGDGLLIVGRRPATAKSPHGGGMAVITLYGMSAQESEAWRERWLTWWSRALELIEVQPAPAA